MSESHCTKVAVLLIRFSELNKTQQNAFLNELIPYLSDTAQARAEAVGRWQRSGREREQAASLASASAGKA